MAEKNKFVVIEEKPKRGPDGQKYVPPPIWLILMSLLGATFFTGVGFVIGEVGNNRPSTELELTATLLIYLNRTTVFQQTETTIAIEAYNATRTPAAISTLISVYEYQTPLAARQAELSTFEAQAMATLTASTSSP